MKKSFRKWALSGLIAMLSICLFTIVNSNNQINASEETYQIGTDVTFPPFEFANGQNKYVGIDIDILKAAAKDQGFKVNIKPMSFNGAIQATQSGQVDGMIAGMSITPQRKNTFDFSNPYFSSGVVAATKPNSDITSLKQLKGKKVDVKTGSQGAEYADKIKNRYGFKVTTFDDSNNMYEDVMTGNAAACLEDNPVMQYGIKQGIKLKIFTKPAISSPYGFAVDKGKNQVLLTKFNRGLAHIKKTGEYKKIVDKYLNAKSSNEMSADNSFIGLIKQNKDFLINGLVQTLWLTIISIFFATLFGLVFGLIGVLPNKFCEGLSTTVIYIFRGLPLLVLALFIYTGIPSLTGTKIPAFIAGVITLMFNEGAYIAAFTKGGIQSVDKGQMEAARSLGLPFGKAMRKVILPQGIKLIIPSFVNQLIITLKDTSILSVIGILELTQTGKIIIARNLQGFKIWSIVAIMYLIIITILTWLSNWIKRSYKI